jgi:Trypsin-like peptidase domain
MRTRADMDLPSVRYGSHIDLNQPSVTLEQLDARSLALEPNQIGINRSVEVSPNTRAQKFVNPDASQVIVLIIKSSGASSVGVHFRNFALADDEEVYVYGAATDSIVFGPFTDKGPWGSGEFWSGTVDGDTVVIEFYKNTDRNGQGFEIFEISHILAELDWRVRSNEPEVLNREVDASCYGDPEKNAVARILFNNNGPHVCTGSLLNNLAQDQTPYVLTVNHCVNSQAVAQTVEAYWFYQTTSCNSGVLRKGVHSPPGANLLATESSNDFSLLRLLNNAPNGAVFSGWTSVPQSTGTSVFGLHHPDGYFPPSIPSYLRRSTGSITSTNESCLALADGYEINWTSGSSEPESSGSGLWKSSRYLVGVASCAPIPASSNTLYAQYSKFANFYPQIRQYIYSATPSAPWTAQAAESNSTQWTNTQWNSGVTVTWPAGTLFSFVFPTGTGHVNSIRRAQQPVALFKTVKFTYKVVKLSGNPKFVSLDPAPAPPGFLPNCRIMLQRTGDDWKGGIKTQHYRWWSTGTLCSFLKADGHTYTYSVQLIPKNWSNVWGKLGTQFPAEFKACLANLDNVQLVFGGGNSFSHGLRVRNGSARYTMLTYRVE